MSEPSPLFVGIGEGQELQKSILECSKEILESLKEYENLRQIKREKQKLTHKLRSQVREASRLIGSVKNNLPKVKTPTIKKVAKKKAAKEEPMPEPVKPQHKSEVEKLEAELAEIEAKLNSL